MGHCKKFRIGCWIWPARQVVGLWSGDPRGATTFYDWDHRNRLEKVTFKRNDGTVTKRVENYYDMFNRWTKRVLDHDGDTGSATPRVDRLIYDGDVLIQDFTEYSDSHTFMHGPLPDMVIFDYHENELRIPLGDHLNTIRDVVAHDGTDWNIVNHVTIDSFGRRLAESDDTIEVFHGLGGRPYDEETGLQNHLHRWYDPGTGRWISEDPIGFGGGHANLNVYTGNSPVNRVDPNGLEPVGLDDAERAAWRAKRLAEMEIRRLQIEAYQQALADMQNLSKLKIPENEWESIGWSISSIYKGAGAIGADLAGYDEVANELYDEAYKEGPLGQTADAPGYHEATWVALGVSSVAAVGALVAGTVSAIATWASPVIQVTHWGPKGMTGLRTGDWVMQGGPTWSNYIQSGMWGGRAWPSNFVTAVVPKSALAKPPGWEIIKVILGQRIYIGG